MKTSFHTNTLVMQDDATAKLPIKVCMHVLGSVRIDPRVMREATALVEAGFVVSIVDIEGKCNQSIEEEIDGVCVKHIIMPKSFISTRFNNKWALIRAVQILICSTLWLIRTPADIYHAHDVSGLPACYIASRLRCKPLIFDAHELPLVELSNGLFRRIRTLLNWLLSCAVSHCAGIITVSLPIAQEICKRYYVPNVSLVRNVLQYQTTRKSDRLREHLGLNSEIHIALYQGSFHRSRGLDRLIHAAAFLKQNIVIVIMGQGETGAQLEALITSEGVADRVKILPSVPYTELLDWTASADLGLIVYSPDYSLNVQMCLPNKLFEYLMAGLPVLASQLDAVSDVIRAYDVGQIVTSLTPKNIGEAINTMLEDRSALNQMRRNALIASQKDLCWEKERQQLIHLYYEVLAK